MDVLELEFESFVYMVVRVLREFDHAQLRTIVLSAILESGEMGDAGYGGEGIYPNYKIVLTRVDHDGEDEEYQNLKQFGTRDSLNLLVSGGNQWDITREARLLLRKWSEYLK